MNSTKDHYKLILQAILPEEIFSYFEITQVIIDEKRLDIHLDELYQKPETYSSEKLQSKGFQSAVIIQDFPIRERMIYLHVRKRKWFVYSTGQIISRDWDLVAKGARYTKGFASFLKELLDNYPISSKSLEKHYYIDGNQFSQQYKEHLSGFNQWDQKLHAHLWMIFPNNIGPRLSIDETALSNGELYTLVTNKAAKGRSGALVAMIKGTRSENIISILKKIPEFIRDLVQEVTLDMAGSMNKIVKRSFPKANKVIDRFHVQKLAYDALQEMRIAHRWDAINEEAETIKEALYRNQKYQPTLFSNGDSKKQLLARSRYLLFKSANNWTTSQKKRANILFAQYPDIKEAYLLTHNLRLIFTQTKDKGVAYTKLARWYKSVEQTGFKAFTSIKNTIQSHYQGILNYFDNRSTNASAESFNAKIKAFRSALRGVRDINFFLFRLSKIYA